MNKAEINDLRSHALYDQIKTDRSLSERLRPDVEAAPWVISEVKKLEARIREQEARIAELESISLEQIKTEGGTVDELVSRAAVLHAFNELIAGLEKAEGGE
jgi:hypothetical protein